MIEAATQPEGAVEHADAAFYPRPEAKAPPEPTLLLVLLSLVRATPTLGQHDALYPRFLGQPLVLGRVEASICCQKLWRSSEVRLVRL